MQGNNSKPKVEGAEPAPLNKKDIEKKYKNYVENSYKKIHRRFMKLSRWNENEGLDDLKNHHVNHEEKNGSQLNFPWWDLKVKKH